MKLYLAILHVIALLALTGSTLGDGDGEATSPRVCTVVKQEEHSDMFGALGDMALDCVARDGTGIEELKKHIKNFDELKTFFKKICDKRQQIRECLSVVEEQSEVCLDQTGHDVFKILRELLETTLDSGCIQDGQVVASMVTIYDNSSSGPLTIDPFHSCVASGIVALTRSTNVVTKQATAFFLLYRDAINVKECFGRITHEDDVNTAREMASIIGDIVAKMKCIHPQDGTAVLCTAMDVTLPDTPRLCPIKTHKTDDDDENGSTVFDLLFPRLSSCFDSGDFEREQLNIETLDMSLLLMKYHCIRRRMIGRCLSDVAAFSSVCLDETQHNVIKILEDSLQHAVEYSCIAEGEYLGYVLYKVMSDMKKTPAQTTVKDCLPVVDGIHSGTGSDAAKVLIYHQQLKVFKGCVIDKLRGDNRAVFNAETFLTLVQKSMKCIEPEHGTMVLCETLDPTPSTGTKACPYVGEHEDEPPKYEMFVDFGFNCLKASTKDFVDLEYFTTLEEFRTFSKSFCRDRPAVGHCLDAVSSNSAACQNQTNHQVMTIVTDSLHFMLETACEGDGEVLATIMHGLDNDAHLQNATESDKLETCLDTAGDQMKTARLPSVSLSSKTMSVYRSLESLKECILNANYGVEFKNVFAKFVNDVLRSVKCIHPEDGTLVLCETIINN